MVEGQGGRAASHTPRGENLVEPHLGTTAAATAVHIMLLLLLLVGDAMLYVPDDKETHGERERECCVVFGVWFVCVLSHFDGEEVVFVGVAIGALGRHGTQHAAKAVHAVICRVHGMGQHIDGHTHTHRRLEMMLVGALYVCVRALLLEEFLKVCRGVHPDIRGTYVSGPMGRNMSHTLSWTDLCVCLCVCVFVCLCVCVCVCVVCGHVVWVCDVSVEVLVVVVPHAAQR